MLTQEEDVEAHALRKRGWSYSAIARHLGVSRNTVKAYLRDGRQPGEWRRSIADAFDQYQEYVAQRLRDDPHIWGSALYDEVRRLGYQQSYITFMRQIRQRDLRPRCEACASRRGHAPTIEIPHEPGDEIQWDWVELTGAPWEPDNQVHLLNGTLPYSGRTRGVFAELEDQPHLIEAIDKALRRLGGTARQWRVDRMSTVVDRQGKLLPSFTAVAKYYGVTVAVCPSRRAKRKGAVEKAQDFSAQRWWRAAEVETPEQAQRSYDRFCVEIGDRRPRSGRTVADLALEEHLLNLPDQPYPAQIELERTVWPASLVHVRGNRYRLMPGLEGAKVLARWALGDPQLKLFSAAGQLLAQHRRAPDGAHELVQLEEQRLALEKAVLDAFATREPCRRKENRPPGPIAKAIAARLTGATPIDVEVDLQRYAEWAKVAAQ